MPAYLVKTLLYCLLRPGPVKCRRWVLFLGLGLLPLLSGCEQRHTFSTNDPNPYKKLFRKPGKTSIQRLPANTLAKVNIDTVTATLFDFYIKNKKKTDPDAGEITRRTENLNELINLVLLAQKAQQEGFQYNETIRARLRLQRLSMLAGLYLENLKLQTKISDETLRKAYRRHYLDRQNYEYKTRHILVKERKLAIRLLRELAAGADFSALAKKHSIAPSAEVGGALEWFRPQNIDKGFADAVIGLDDGDVTPAPVKTKHGWHLILREETRRIEPPKFEQVKRQLYTRLQNEKIEQFLRRLKKKSTIIIAR